MAHGNDYPMSSGENWRMWSLEDWNNALFKHYFIFGEGGDAAVTRISITKEELARATRDENASPEEVSERFLDVIRNDRLSFNRALSEMYRRSLQKTSSIPPFCIYLLFTCYVASGDEQVLRDGDFRVRLGKLLDDLPRTQYPLSDLAKLWKKLRDWLQEERGIRNEPYRELILPKPGHMSRIGYSVRLAFPNRRDRLKMTELLAAVPFDSSPLVKEVLTLVDHHILRFSDAFRAVYSQFRAAYLAGELGLYEHPFWSTVREVVRSASFLSHDTEKALADVLLLMDVDEMGMGQLRMLSDSPARGMGRSDIRTWETEASIGRYRFFVAAKSEDAAGVDLAVEWLLQKRLASSVPEFRKSSLHKTVEHGVLLFALNEDGVYQLVTRRPEMGDLIAIVREDLAPPFIQALRSLGGSTTERVKSLYPGWDQLSGLHASDLVQIDFRMHPKLRNIRCLRGDILLERLRLVNGIRLENGYLGQIDCLPALLAENMDRLVAYGVDAGSSNTRIVLERAASDPNIFLFPGRNVLKADLDGLFNIDAERESRLQTRRQVQFRAGVISHDYAEPATPEQWLVEGGTTDMTWATHREEITDGTEMGGAHRSILAKQGRDSVWKGGERESREDSVAPELLRRSQGRPEMLCGTSASPICLNEEHRQRLEGMLEACAAISIRRSGIAEYHLMQQMRTILRVPHHLIWDVVRGWTESGFFDLLTSARWRTRRYFARIPRLVVSRTGSRFRATLTGLAPGYLRARLESTAKSLDMTVHRGSTYSSWVPESLYLEADSLSAFHQISEKVGMDSVQWLKPLEACLVPLDNIVKLSLEIPINYDNVARWSWEEGRFIQQSTAASGEIAVDLYRRLDSPDYYLLRHRDDPIWFSYSRTWALLAAFEMKGKQWLASDTEGHLYRTEPGGTYLPVTIGRWIFAAAGNSPGPVQSQEEELSYVYPFGQSRYASRAVQLLRNTYPTCDEGELLGWMLPAAMARSRRERLLLLPRALRETLRQRERRKEVRTLLERGIPRSLYGLIVARLKGVEY